MISADVECAAGNGLLLKYSPNANMKLAEAAGKHSPMAFTGDLSSFAGRLTVQSNILFTAGAGTMPGEVKLEKGVYFGVHTSSDRFSVGSLTLNENDHLVVPQDANGGSTACIEVTDTLTFPASARPLKVELGSVQPFAGNAACTILKIARDAYAEDLTEGDFELRTTAFMDEACRTKLTVSRDGDGNQLVALALQYPLYKMTVADPVGLDHVDDTQSGYTNGWQWSEADDKPPHAGAVYDTDRKCLRTPYDATGTTVFPGHALILDGDTFRLRAATNVVDRLYVLADNSSIINYYTFNAALLGEMTLGNTLIVYSYGNAPDARGCYRGIKIHASLKGTGTLRATTNQGSSNLPGETYLGGDNSAFAGQIRVTIYTTPAKGYPNYTNGYAVLSFDDAAKLGGPMASFRSDAILVEQKCVLRPLATTTLGEMTRGVTFCDGRVNTREAETVFTIKPPVHFQQLMRKEGAGVLVLEGAGTCSSTGEVQVLGGLLQARRKDAFAGVPMSFAAGTGLRYDVCPQDPDMATYGIYAATAGTIAAEGDSIKVTFADDDPETTFATKKVVPLMTVAEADADGLKAKLKRGVVRPQGVRVVLTTRTVDPNTVTISAEMVRVGMTVSFR